MRITTQFLILVPLLLGMLGMTPVKARDLNEIKQSGVIIVATEGGFYPFNYVEDSKLKGYEVDIGAMIAQELGVEIQWRVIAFEAIMNAVRQDRVDFAIASHAYLPERAERVDFALPHYCTGATIAAKKGGPLTRNALKGKIVGVQMSTSYFDNAKAIKEVGRVKSYRTEAEIFKALNAGKVDAWISDKWLIRASLKKNPDSGIEIGEQISEEKNSIILRKNNTGLLNEINRIIAKKNADGTLAWFSKRYWGTDITCKKAN